MKINKTQLLKWISALRSENFNQTKGKLQDKEGYCCLGVACEVLIPKKKKNLNEEGFIKSLSPEMQTHAPEWLKRINMAFCLKTNLSLITLNDSEDYTFNEIADLLELVYIHKALED